MNLLVNIIATDMELGFSRPLVPHKPAKVRATAESFRLRVGAVTTMTTTEEAGEAVKSPYTAYGISSIR